jgi:ABC-type transport system substrate-binding protein
VAANPVAIPSDGASTSTITVTVTDPSGAAVIGDPVFVFRPGVATCGTLSPSFATTNAAGQASVTYTASATPGSCTITVIEAQSAGTGSISINQTGTGQYRPPQRTGGTITYADWQFPDSTNPWFVSGLADLSLQSALWGSPIRANSNGRYVPDQLVEVPTVQNRDVSPDGLSVVMKLRPDLRWSDGQPITADDFVYWEQTELDPATGAVSPYGYDQIASIVARDASTVVLTYRQPFGPYLQYLPFAAPKHAWGSIPDQSLAATQNVNLTPSVNSGPFTISAFAAGQSFTMVPNPHYTSSTFHQSVLDQLIFKGYPDQAALIAAYQAGQVQQADDLRLRNVPQLQGVPGLLIPPEIGYELVLPNLSTPVLQDLHVRKAIAESIDRCQLIQVAVGVDCKTVQVGGVLPRPSPYFDPAASLPAFDLAQARADLQAAGWDCSSNPCTKNGQPFPTLTLVTTAGNPLREFELALIQQDLAAVGIRVALQLYRPGLLFGSFTSGGILATGQYDLAVFANVFNFDPDDLAPGVQSNGIPGAQSPGGGNYGRINDPQLDTFFAQGRATVDQLARLTIYKQATELIANQVYFVPLYLASAVTLTSPQIVNYASNIAALSDEWNVGDWWLGAPPKELRGVYAEVGHLLSPCCADFPHTLTITSFDPATGQLTGTGTNTPFTFTGQLTGSHITLHTTSPSSSYVSDLDGTVQPSRSMSGTFTDNLGQSGTWTASPVSVLWLGNDMSGAVFETDPSGQVLTGLSNLPRTGMASDGTTLYFGDLGGNIEQRTNDGLQILKTFRIPVSGAAAEDLAWDTKRQRLWRIDHGNTLHMIDVSRGIDELSFSLPTTDPGDVLTPLGGLGVAYDPGRDLLYVSFCQQGCVQNGRGLVERVDPSTGSVTGVLFRSAVGLTAGLAYESDTDSLWVGDNSVVRDFSLSGAVLSAFTRPQPGGAVDGLEFVPGTPITGQVLAPVTGLAQCGTTPLPGATVQLFSGSSLVATTTAGESGQFAFPSAGPGVYTVRVTSGGATCGYQVTISPSGIVGVNPTAQCPPDSLHNHSWITASPLDALSLTPAPAKVDACLYRQDQSAWFKVPIQPGSKVNVSLTNLPANYDITLYKDIAGAYQTLTSPSSSLTRLSAEFAPDAYSPDAYSPDAYSPDAYSPDAYSPDAYSPDAYSPDAYSPDAYSPDAYSPDAYSPDAYSPDAYSPSTFSPDAYSPATPVQNALTGSALAGEPVAPTAYAGAQTRSLIGVSANNGTASEHIVRNTWDNSTNFYVRVRGRNGLFNLAQPFHLEVALLTGECGAIKSVDALTAGTTPSLLSGTAGSFNSVILWDSSRASRLAGWSAADLSTVTSHLASLATRTAGVVVDVSTDDRVKAANLQADANPACPYAKNLVGLEIKRIVDAYRGLNPLKYVVIVGSDGLIPFFRHPDQAGLASERNFVPPVADASPSQATLKLGYVLSQDRYGSSTDLSVNDHTLPLPDLAVGRLIERPADINGLIDAYLKTPASGVAPTSSLATGYDFFADAATAIAGQLTLGTTHPTDTLIQSSGPPTVAGGAWTADQLRAKLLSSRHDVIFLGAHFSAFSAEAADFSSHMLATEVANSTLDWSNVVVFSEGCHSGYNTVDRDAIPIPLVEPDFPQAFAQKGATLIGGSGYQYGDTDFIEYGERLYLEFSKQLRTGIGPVSVGQALIAAKKAYLRDTPQLRGIHEKTLLESTLYGLPQLMVNMPGSRITPPADTSVVRATTRFENKPGSVLGLSSADVTVRSTLTAHTVTINSTSVPPAPLSATYFSGSNGQVANPSEPVLPLEARNVTAPGPPGSAPILRGVGFRGGSYTDNPTSGPVLPLTDAPSTELRGLHSFFFSSAFYPIRPWRVNYFDALTGGAATGLDVTPAQYLSSGPASQTGTLRAFSSMNFRLYYSDPTLSTATYGQTATYPGNIPALAAAPAISQVSALPSPDGKSVTFRVRVEGDPSAGIQQVWVTYTAAAPSCSGGPAPCAGQWQSLDLVQDAADSTLWTATLPLGSAASADVRYLVQAVNGVGMVGMATNLGTFYVPGPDTVPLTAPKQSTRVALSSPPASGTYRDRATFTAVLTANGAPVTGRPLVFEFGPQRLQAVTDASGSASVTFPLLQTPGQYQVRAALEEASDLLGSASESLFTITQQNTVLTLTGGTAHYSDPTPVVATLSDHSTPTPRRLREQTVVFIVSGNSQPAFVLPVITDELGRAPLGPLPLPAGTYTVAAYFSGTIPIPSSTGVVPLTLTNDRYNSSTATLSNGLTITPELATVAYSGDTIDAMNSPIHLAATVTQETDDLPGDIANAKVEFAVKDAAGKTVGDTTAAVAADGTATASIPGLPPGLYTVESTVVGGFYSSPTATALLAVYNPSAFVTGGGWILAAGAPPTQKTTFSLAVQYPSGATTPTGNLEAVVRESGVDLVATSFDWLVISDSTAQFQGTGTINGSGTFRFRVTVTTGAAPEETFQIRIWDSSHSFTTPLYRAAGTLGGGEIKVHF